MDTVILGINPGSASSHQSFASRLELPFPLLVDVDGRVAKAYGAVKDDGPGIQRTVVIVDKAGLIRYAKAGMPPDEELIEAIEGL